VVDDVLARTALTDFRERHVDRLSGGERQRVVFARCLAQQTDVLLLDEATASLDMQHAIELLNLAARRVATGATVIAVMQDINLAAIYCDHLVCIRQGRLAAAGPTDRVLTAELLHEVFRVNARVEYHPHANALQVVFNREMP
jgi:iron complex transport system ATP-binding protein